ncbi:hypothetical protein PVAP13_3KG129133 [Panicum virgatum]|uniref:Secreted protein n=1 Tax=Panicum virgatum TaxID=38727 RepID=A0A8T0V3W4_PANVG|nr:hypothetical protein PVAP13_3KG129133 [Panicum virgatum]
MRPEPQWPSFSCLRAWPSCILAGLLVGARSGRSRQGLRSVSSGDGRHAGSSRCGRAVRLSSIGFNLLACEEI